MPISLRLDDARTEVIHIAGIDGKTGANSRHSPTRLNAILNRKYRNLRSRVSQLGYPHFLVPGSSSSLPGRAAGEDFQEISLPAGVAEIGGVDVKANDAWRRLDPLGFDQRRDGNLLCPPSGTGFWMIHQAPVSSTTSITAGKLAVFPHSLTGSYKLWHVDAWTDIATDTHVFMLYEAWDDWLLNAAAMACCQRDAKIKNDNYAMAEAAWRAADALIVEGAQRLNRAGYVSPTPYGGVQL